MTHRRSVTNDDGATLVIAMIIITTIAVVVAALLGQSDTSIKTTFALRDQAGSAYNGDAAAQVAINTLRKGNFNNVAGSSCFSASDTLDLQDFYPPIDDQQASLKSSASVTCSAESGTGAQGSPVIITSA